ncbi:Uncharacterised protein [uncultured archaeon]|nr:Uncharacterised protein [uncultured archaeon]
MAKVEISEKLKEDIYKKFKEESTEIFNLIYSLRENPKKGKEVGQVSGILIKELRYKSFRFYFITNGYQLRVLDLAELQDLVIRFVRMSDKKSQQKVIDEIKQILRSFGEKGFK